MGEHDLSTYFPICAIRLVLGNIRSMSVWSMLCVEQDSSQSKKIRRRMIKCDLIRFTAGGVVDPKRESVRALF